MEKIGLVLIVLLEKTGYWTGFFVILIFLRKLFRIFNIVFFETESMLFQRIMIKIIPNPDRIRKPHNHVRSEKMIKVCAEANKL